LNRVGKRLYRKKDPEVVQPYNARIIAGTEEKHKGTVTNKS